MRNFCLLIFMSSLVLAGKAQKVYQNRLALIVQNTKFDNPDWQRQSFAPIANSAATVKNLLKNKGFPPGNILFCENLSAPEYRDTIKAFRKKLADLRTKYPHLVVVQYLLSHGTTLLDTSGDEREADPQKKDIFDEVFVSTDTPNQTELFKGHQKTKDNKDYHPHAIVDDELGTINEDIIHDIGAEGHYLLLSDFCNSERGAKDANRRLAEELNQLTDGSDFFDFTPKPSPSQSPTFIMLSASNSSINIASHAPKTSYFVQALVKAFEYPWVFVPTYRDLYGDFKAALMHLDAKVREANKGTDKKDEGVFKKGGKVPDIYQQPEEGADKTLFNESTLDKSISFFKSWFISDPAGTKGDRGDVERFTFYKPDSVILLPFSYVTISEAKTNRVVGSGLVENVTEENSGVLLPKGTKIEPNIDYLLTSDTAPLERAYATLQRARNKMELREVLKELHSPLLGVKVKTLVNAYEQEKAGDTTWLIPNNKDRNLKKEETVTTKDNITVKINLPGQDLYYTIVEVTAQTGIQACYTDISGKGKGFSFKHSIPLMRVVRNGKIISLRNWEEHHFRSKFTAPFNTPSYLWVLVSDTPIDDEDFRNIFLGTTQIRDEVHRTKLWHILKHIRHFEELSYEVNY